MFDDVEAWREAFYSQGLGHRGRDLTAYHCRVRYIKESRFFFCAKGGDTSLAFVRVSLAHAQNVFGRCADERSSAFLEGVRSGGTSRFLARHGKRFAKRFLEKPLII